MMFTMLNFPQRQNKTSKENGTFNYYPASCIHFTINGDLIQHSTFNIQHLIKKNVYPK